MAEHWVCFTCRKQFRTGVSLPRDWAWTRSYKVYGVNDTPQTIEHPCPECKAPMVDMGRFFRPPRRNDRRAWESMRRLTEHGIRFTSTNTLYYLGRRPLKETARMIAECRCHTRTEGQRLLLKIARKAGKQRDSKRMP